jgi:predicted dehydrogenase
MESASGTVMLGHIVLFSPLFRALLVQIRSRPPLRYFHFVRHRPATTAELFPEETPLTLTMVHDLYLAYALMGGAEPERMHARLRSSGTGFDLAQAEIEWPGWVWGSFTASFLTPQGMAADGFDRVELFGEGWSARLSLNPQPLETWSDRAEWPVALDIHVDPPSGWLAEELRCFCRVVRDEAMPPLGARYEDGVRLQEWMERLRASAAA